MNPVGRNKSGRVDESRTGLAAGQQGRSFTFMTGPQSLLAARADGLGEVRIPERPITSLILYYGLSP